MGETSAPAAAAHQEVARPWARRPPSPSWLAAAQELRARVGGPPGARTASRACHHQAAWCWRPAGGV